jgi:hypothetical protein
VKAADQLEVRSPRCLRRSSLRWDILTWSLQANERQVICVIDGDGTIFSRDLVGRGREGGLAAIRLLISAIGAHLADGARYQLWIYCFMNKRGLAGALGVADAMLDEFVAGFNQADSRAFLVDIGYGKEVADARIRGNYNVWYRYVS